MRFTMRGHLLRSLSLLCLLASCHTSPAQPTPGPSNEWPTDGTMRAHPRQLPFTFERPDVGEAVTSGELAAATDAFLELLEKTRYFDLINDRVHGWPESGGDGRYWYGTWWSGVSVQKREGKVTYLHGAGGADNNGLRTAQLLEGACFSYALGKTPAHQHLLRKLMRGFTSWFLAMERTSGDNAIPLLSRAAYPASVTSHDGGHELFIDYSLNRPGEDNGATVYVHLPNNPSWGDLWVKNKRSKDDIGHMLRAVAQLDTCDGLLDADAQAELKDLRRRFVAWAKKVEDDEWSIATLDKELQVVIPEDGLAHFFTAGGLECGAQLSVRLQGRGEVGDLDCGDNTLLDEGASALNNSAMQIVRSFHEASIHHALLANRTDTAEMLLGGLGHRLDVIFDRFDANMTVNTPTPDLAALVLHSANAGVPLTSREVRWLHARLKEAHDSYGVPSPAYDIFAASTPDGSYSYDPSGSGLDFKDIGLLLGSCVAQYRNPSSRPLLDCEKVRSWMGAH
jgi:hypothetical protein